ncbi:class I SAM-dependent methyltransferase [Rubinisphaera margarita]|uniref:class I SAM-dependent methyltransferase n=1 Tax=Rubinisphaera margarita TaxID=2909586 RepID=UPI001EE7897F|nr:class I SAM-dependent methyltransferase [Rubinisphaera margarita]MCG6157901.1 class I SAM-dependent methyltransferase [Rubinisphaera margarita]
MKWQLKACILRHLSRWPGGRNAYLAIQRFLGTTRPQSRRDLTRAIQLIELIREAGQPVKGRRLFEIGTGWHPYTPLGFYLTGAEHIETVDVNPWLSLSSAKSAVDSAERDLEWFAEKLELNQQIVRDRYERIDFQATRLEDFLASFNCRYVYPGDATASGHPAESFDFVVSSNVLEHIPAEILRQINRESLRILKPGGLAVHRFNPGDHYANDDSSISSGNFLRFSPEEWERYGSGLAYHNRLRCSQYSKLFREAGFLALIEDQRVDARVLEEIKAGSQPLAPEFAGLLPEDLAADYMWTVGMKGHVEMPAASTNGDSGTRTQTDQDVSETFTS